jgi:hypothetical protein
VSLFSQTKSAQLYVASHLFPAKQELVKAAHLLAGLARAQQ